MKKNKQKNTGNKRVQKTVKKAMEDWIGTQCEETVTCLKKKKQQDSILVGGGFNLRETW